MVVIVKRKFSVFIVLLALLGNVLLLPLETFADELTDEDNQQENPEFKLASVQTDDNEEVPVFETSDLETSNILIYLNDDDEISVIETGDTFSLIDVKEDTDDEVIQGYIENKFIVFVDEFEASSDEASNSREEIIEAESSNENVPKEEIKETSEVETKNEKVTTFSQVQPNHLTINLHGITMKDKTEVYDQPRSGKVITSLEQGTIVDFGSHDEDWYHLVVSVDSKEVTGYVKASNIEIAKANQQSIKGKALKSPTYIREHASTKASAITNLPIGTIIEYKPFSTYWHEIKVQVGGKEKTGYIHRKHIDQVTEKNLQTIAGKPKTYIRTQASTKSEALTIVDNGTILNYGIYPANTNWYEVEIDNRIGYVHKKHVNEIFTTQEKLRGITKNAPTYIRTKPSTKAKALTKTPIGSVMNYKTFSEYWYEVSINGEIGYVHRKHVENISSEQKSEHGLALKSPTNVRSRASTQSNIISTIPSEEIFEYKTFSKYWYEVTYDGKTGYVHKNHLENVKNMTFRGIAQKSPTNIRTEPSTKSKVLVKKSQGTVIEYEYYNSYWYKVKEGNKTGYIHKKHVENAIINQESLRGVALKNKTYIRTTPSTKSNAITTRSIGTVLNYKTFSKHWYEVSINGKTGYVHKKHVETATRSPKTVAAYALKAPTRIRAVPSTKAKAITTLPQGSIVNYRTFSSHWHEVTVNVNGKNKTGFVHRKHVGETLNINHASNPKVVYIDAGHGGSDSGAIGNGLREKDITLKTAKMVESLLKVQGYKVIMSRTADSYPTLSDRTNEANRHNADLFISIHVNAGGGAGIETWWYDKGPESVKSKRLAKELQDEMIKATGANNRGVKNGNLHVNRESKMPSSLVEIGFIDNARDAARMKQDSYLKSIASAIVKGIRGFFQATH